MLLFLRLERERQMKKRRARALTMPPTEMPILAERLLWTGGEDEGGWKGSELVIEGADKPVGGEDG